LLGCWDWLRTELIYLLKLSCFSNCLLILHLCDLWYLFNAWSRLLPNISAFIIDFLFIDLTFPLYSFFIWLVHSLLFFNFQLIQIKATCLQLRTIHLNFTLHSNQTLICHPFCRNLWLLLWNHTLRTQYLVAYLLIRYLQSYFLIWLNRNLFLFLTAYRFLITELIVLIHLELFLSRSSASLLWCIHNLILPSTPRCVIAFYSPSIIPSFLQSATLQCSILTLRSFSILCLVYVL
jgi:hypothetical protein